MISGLIGDAISIHFEDNRNTKFEQKEYGDSREGTSDHYRILHEYGSHRCYYWETQDLTGLFLARHSLLGDPILHLDVKDLFFGTQNMILDVDFKFFTYSRNVHGSLVRELTLLGSNALNLFFQNNNIILDLDLDFFTYSFDKVYARNKRDVMRQINSTAFEELVAKAQIITIALEPKYCGSEDDSREILEVFCQRFPSLDLKEITTFFFST